VNVVDKATETQLTNIQTKTGKAIEELYGALRASGETKHGQLRDFAKTEFGLGYGDANTLVHMFLRSTEPAQKGDPLDAIYVGAKAGLRPIHDKLKAAIDGFGEYEVAPKKGYVSLRRKKQFCMVGPATNSRVDVGLNVRGLAACPRLAEMPPGDMCQYKVKLTDPAEVDEELIAWVRVAYDNAG
jgi:hypothetical protein